MHEDYGYRCLTASGLVHDCNCMVHGIIVSPDGTNASYADVFDGPSNLMPLVMRVRVSTTASVAIIFHHPLRLTRGLYITFGSNLAHVTTMTSQVNV